MAQPPAYNRQFDFSDFSATNPNDQQPGSELDAEFDALKTTTDGIRTNLALIQRDDGALRNASVGVDQLQPSVRFGLNAVSDWATGTVYVVNAGVWQTRKLYRCLVAHTSGTFSTDLGAGKWELLVDFDQWLTVAEGAAEDAHGDAEAAATARNAAVVAQGLAEDAAEVAQAAQAAAGIGEVQAGSASTPGLRVQGDTDTGLFFPAANTLAIATGGVERLRVQSGLLRTRTGAGTNIAMVPDTAHQAGSAGHVSLSVSDGGGYSGVFVDNTHDGTYSSQRLRFLAAKGGVTGATEYGRLENTGVWSLGGAPGSESLEVVPVASAARRVQVEGATSGNHPKIKTNGGDLELAPATGVVRVASGGFRFADATAQTTAALGAANASEAATGTATDKAITPAALAGWLPALTELTSGNVDPAADFVPVYDASGTVMRKAKPNNLGITGGGSDTSAGEQHLWLPAALFATHASAGAQPVKIGLSNDANRVVDAIAFDAASAEYVEYIWQPPKRWDGTFVRARVYWHASGGSGDVAWNVQFSALADQGAISSSSYEAYDIVDTYNGSNLHVTADDTALAGGPVTFNNTKTILVSVGRNAASGSDTYGNDANFIGVLIGWTATGGNDA